MVALASTIVPTSGRAKLEGKFLSMLEDAGVSEEICNKLGESGCNSSMLFGGITEDEKEMILYLQGACNLDVTQRADDFLPRARLLIVWKACKARQEFEVKHSAQRAVENLPPQATDQDFGLAKEALEKIDKMDLLDYETPSKPYWERKMGEVATGFVTESLTQVTNKTQEDVTKQKAEPCLTQEGKIAVKMSEFTVPLPQDAEDLENRIKVMGACLMMVKQRFHHNPKLHTCNSDLFVRYVKWLKGPMIWGMHSLGPDDKPQSCPHIGHVMRYDKAVRTQVNNRMNRGQDIQAAWEAALADDTLKRMNLEIPFTCDANTPECRALTAPGLRAMYNMGPAPTFSRKRPSPSESLNVVRLPNGNGGVSTVNTGLSKNQKKRARQAANKAKGSGAAAAAIEAPPVPLAIMDAKRTKGDGKKGGGKGAKGGKGKGGLPKGASAKTADDRSICFAYNRCEKCVQTPCTFVHCCWFCGGDHPGNSNKCPKKK